MRASAHIPTRGYPPARAGRHSSARWLGGVAVLLLGAVLAMAMAAPPIATPATPPRMAVDGLPPIHNFDPTDYGGAAQNWAVTQGDDGVIYVGNSEDGVLTFDGSQWQRIPVRDKLVVRSLATGPGGRIYVGTVGDFGYLKPDATGQLRYVSLLDQVPVADRDFADVWSIFRSHDTIYFAAQARLFVLHDQRIRVITPARAFHMTFLVAGTLYAREAGRGLVRLAGDQFQTVRGGERFATERVYGLVAYRGPGAQPGGLLAATRSHGWFRFDGKTWQAWPTEADAALRSAEIYSVLRLANGELAIATLKDGLYFLDDAGRLLGHLDHTNGLGDDSVLGLYQDRERGLWLASNAGVSRVDLNSPITRFGASEGLYGAMISITRHAGSLYAGTDAGVFRLAGDVDGKPWFKRLPGAPGQNWSFAAVGDQLLTAGNEGVFAIRPNDTTQPILHGSPGHPVASQVLLRSRLDRSRVFVGLQDGLRTLRWTGTRWIDEGQVAGVADQVVALAMDAANQVWAGPSKGGVLRITLPPAWRGPRDPRPVTVAHFGARAGVPQGLIQPVIVDGQPLFLANTGIYRFDPHTRRFSPDAGFANLFPEGPRAVVPLTVGQHGRLWMYTENPPLNIRESGYATRADGHWQWHVAPLQPLEGESMLAIYQDGDGAVWFGSYRGLFRLDPAREPVEDATLSTRISAVTTPGGIYLPIGGTRRPAPAVPWAHNDLRFQFALPSFGHLAANRYQVYLEGSDPGWSPWSTATYRDYTNLGPGRYRFHVRGRDVYGHVGREATFAFRVLPPWYRTPWAWALWIASALLLLGLFVRWRSAALRHRHRALAVLVGLRTAELAQANGALAQNNALLAEQSTTDPLTGLKNRRYLYEHIAQDLAAARRQQGGGRPGPVAGDTSLIFLMVDIDHFKAVNDQYGHGAGDRVLRQLADTLRAMTRGTDIPIRWGGEEFLVVARFAAPDAGPAFAERVRSAVAAHPFDIGDGRVIHCTCSIGFATYPLFRAPHAPLGWDTVINLADACLYAAKRNGRNAWAGVSPSAGAPAGDPLEALRAMLAKLPAPGPFAVRASWLPAVPGDDSHAP